MAASDSPTPKPPNPSDPDDSGAPVEPFALAPSDVPPLVPPKPAKPVEGPLSGMDSVLRVVESEPCPKCGSPMAVDAVLCMKCGYDLAAGRVRKTEVGPAVIKEEEPTIPEFSAKGRLDSAALAVVGALLLGGAMFAAGWFQPAGATAGNRAASVGLTVLTSLIQTGGGLIAVAIAAATVKHRFGSVELAAARMFVAVSAFLLVVNVKYEQPELNVVFFWAIALVQWAAALGLYWLVVSVLFWKKPKDMGVLCGVHFLLYLGLTALIELQSRLQAAAIVLPPVKP